jgi:hypothetical protein
MKQVYLSDVSTTPPALPSGAVEGYPQDGTLTGSHQATVPGPYWFYSVSSEIENAIRAGGQTPDASRVNQLAEIIGGMHAAMNAVSYLPQTLTDEQRRQAKVNIGVSFINARDYGAKGDGETDDTDALQAVFSAASAGGNNVIIPPGTYCISEQVQFGGNVLILAYGATIKASDTDNYTMFANTLGYVSEVGPAGYGGNGHIAWFGGTFDGNCQNSNPNVLRQALAFHHAQDIHLVDVTFKNCRRVHTLEFGGCRDAVVRNCSFYGQFPPEIENYYPEVIQLNPNTVAATPTVYADGTENKNILIDGCLVTNAENSSEITASSPYAGIGSHGNDPGKRTEDVTIRGCTFRGIRYRAATCTNTMFYGWKVLDCTFDGVGQYAVHITHRNDGTAEQKTQAVGAFEIAGCTFSNVPVAIYQEGYSGYYQEDISIHDNVANVTRQFASLHYARNVLVENNAVTLDASSLSGSTMSCYFLGIDSPKLINYRLTTKNTSGVTNLYAATFSTNCSNVRYSGIVSDKTQPPVNQIATTVDGIHGENANFQVFRAKQGQTSNGAPAIALASPDPYNAPQVGYPADAAFWVGAYADDAGGNSVISQRVLQIDASYALCPGTTAAQNLGSASARWKEVFSSTGAINTSDRREKDNISEPSDALMRAWGKVRVRVFQFKDALEKKGADARMHVGLVAQDVVEAFASEGLDAARYGLLCYDKWDAEYETVEIIDAPAAINENGEDVPAKTHTERRLIRPAGDAFGIRYGEALALECAYLRWRLAQIEARIGEE